MYWIEMMKTHAISRRALLSGMGVLALSACTGTSFNQVAGGNLGNGFGEATSNNTLVMNGSAPALSHLGGRFAAEVPTTINFAFNSSELDGAARAVLDEQANFMRTFPEVRFSVYGHTDKVGSNGANQALGRRRAQAAVAYLSTRGISTSRLEALVSFGETRPLVATQGPERANRRTVTEVAGFVDGHPLVLDGKYGQIVYRRYVGGAAGPASARSVAESAAAPAGTGLSAGGSAAPAAATN